MENKPDTAPRKMRHARDGWIHDEQLGCNLTGCVPVEPQSTPGIKQVKCPFCGNTSIHISAASHSRAIPEAERVRVANELADMWFAYCKNPSYEEKGTNREVFVRFAVKAMRTLEKKA